MARTPREGLVLTELAEIRVAALPNWGRSSNAESRGGVKLTFLFILPVRSAFEWQCSLHAERWLRLVPAPQPSGPFKAIEFEVRTLDELPAAKYLASDPLDLDDLSQQAESRADVPPPN